MSDNLGKLAVKSVREGAGRMPMQFAVTGDDLSVMKTWYWSEELSLDAQTAIFRIEAHFPAPSAGHARRAKRYFSYDFLRW